MTETLELTVPELDCADEAQQIQAALSRLPGVAEVRTAVGARRAIVAYDPERIQPDAIRAAIRGLGMTVVETNGRGPGRAAFAAGAPGLGVRRGCRARWRSSGSPASGSASPRP